MLGRMAEVLLITEPVWAMAALAFTFTSLLWGWSQSWIGLAVCLIPYPLRLWRKGYLSGRTSLDLPAVVYFVAALIGLAVSPDLGLSVRAFQSVVACMLLYYLLANVPHPAYIKWGFAFASVCVFVAGLLAFRDGFSPPPLVDGLGTWVSEQLQHLPTLPRSSAIANPTLSATHGLTVAVEVVLLPIAGVVMTNRSLSARLTAAALALPLVMLLVLFGSQGAWLSVFIGLAFLVAWRSRWAFLALAVCVSLGYLGYHEGWIDPQSVFTQFGPSNSLRTRIALWKWAADVIAHHPVTGCGLGVLGEYSKTTLLSPHNAYLQFYADTGLVGALALLGAVVTGGRMGIGVLKAPSDVPWHGFAFGLLAATVALVVHSLFEGSPAGIIAEAEDGYFYIVSPVVAILAGLLVRTRRFMEESTLQSPMASQCGLQTETVL